MAIKHFIAALFLTTSALLAADPPKVEKAANFVPAKEDPGVGDWKGGGFAAQVAAIGDGTYQANLLRAFDTEDKPLAVLTGRRTGDTINFAGDAGWSGTVKGPRFILHRSDGESELEHVTRSSPTLGVPPAKGAIVLFDGSNLDAWAKKAGKEWLKEDGPAKWKLVEGGAVEGGAVEVVPDTDSIITHQKFGDCHLHVEFRTLGAPTNSGVFLQTRYEVNINESYGRLDGNPSGGLDNCTNNVPSRVRASLPPLAWQTLDIAFQAPRFDASGKKSAPARATVLLNGVKIYQDQPLDPPRGAAARLGESPTGPLMLQEHGMPLQFRNIWLVETKPAG